MCLQASWLSLGGVALLVALMRPVHAQSDAQLKWSAPADCPGKAQALLSYQSAMGGPSILRSEVEIEEVGDHYQAQIRIDTKDGTSAPRLVEAESCEAVTEAAVLYLVLTSVALPESDEPPPPPVARIDEANGVVAPAQSLAKSVEGDLRLDSVALPWAPSLAIELGLDRGSMPSSTPFLSLAAALGRGRWSGELRGAIWQTHRAQSPGASHGAAFDLWNLGVQGCAAANRYQLCAGPEVGKLESRAFGIVLPRTPAMTWLAGLVAFRATLVRGDLGEVQLRVQAVAPIYRDRFRFSQDQPLHQPDRVAARVGISYLFHFSSPD